MRGASSSSMDGVRKNSAVVLGRERELLGVSAMVNAISKLSSILEVVFEVLSVILKLHDLDARETRLIFK